jgi:putative transposase
MCAILAVSKNCYYRWLHYPISNRDRNNILLLKQISEAHNNARQLYGYRKVHAALHAANVNCSKNRVYKIMSEAGLHSKIRRRFKATTNSNHKLPVAENLLDRQFTIEHPNSVYVSDITYIRTREGWLYLATVLDLYSRKIVGWSMSDRMEAILVEKALLMAIWNRKPARDYTLMHHSDRGSQYAAKSFQSILKLYKIKCSMSRKGNCWDNAVAESFFSILKTELVYACTFKTREEARLYIFEYIEVFYNQERLHSSLGYKSPAQFEMAA